MLQLVMFTLAEEMQLLERYPYVRMVEVEYEFSILITGNEKVEKREIHKNRQEV